MVTDGEQALQFLHRVGDYADAPRPGLILLDLNLPRRDGLEVLAELKADPVLKVIPVVILTTSQAEQDILRSYALHANAYVSKPVDFERFMDVIRQIDTIRDRGAIPPRCGLRRRHDGGSLMPRWRLAARRGKSRSAAFSVRAIAASVRQHRSECGGAPERSARMA